MTYEGVQYYLGCTFLEQWQKALRRSLLGQGFKLPDWTPADGCCNAYPLPIQEPFPSWSLEPLPYAAATPLPHKPLPVSVWQQCHSVHQDLETMYQLSCYNPWKLQESALLHWQDVCAQGPCPWKQVGVLESDQLPLMQHNMLMSIQNHDKRDENLYNLKTLSDVFCGWRLQTLIQLGGWTAGNAVIQRRQKNCL